MSDGSQDNLSKRERQKQRREARKEAERNAAKRARVTRLAVFALLGLVAAGGVGYLVQQAVAGRAERSERVEQGQQAASEFGCTEVEQPEDLGGGHFSGPELGQNPPDAIYSHQPTTSGNHIGSVVRTGVYDSYVDERLTTHNLEHGYVVLWHAEGAPEGQVDDLKSFAEERIDAGDKELIVAPYNAEMDEGANFAFTAWGNRQLCDEFDADVAFAFLTQFHNGPDAPETNVGPHIGDGVDPENQQAVFPPLGEASGDPGPEADGEQGDGEDAEEDTAGEDAGGDAEGDAGEGGDAGGDSQTEDDAGGEDGGG